MGNAFLALGSNLNDPVSQIHKAVTALKQDPQIRLLRISSLYQTPAMGPPQDDYINAVMHIETDYSPRELLNTGLQIEKQQGRVRREPWGPRCIDIDVLLYDNVVCQEKDYSLPHPGLTQRLFVLVPLYEIAPELILPDGTSIVVLLQEFNNDEIGLIHKI